MIAHAVFSLLVFGLLLFSAASCEAHFTLGEAHGAFGLVSLLSLIIGFGMFLLWRRPPAKQVVRAVALYILLVCLQWVPSTAALVVADLVVFGLSILILRTPRTAVS